MINSSNCGADRFAMQFPHTGSDRETGYLPQNLHVAILHAINV